MRRKRSTALTFPSIRTDNVCWFGREMADITPSSKRAFSFSGTGLRQAAISGVYTPRPQGRGQSQRGGAEPARRCANGIGPQEADGARRLPIGLQLDGRGAACALHRWASGLERRDAAGSRRLAGTRCQEGRARRASALR
jgi:hypothetical protein